MPTERKNRKFNDYQTEKRIHEHLSNKNDNISEEDIRNVKTDIADGESVTSSFLEADKLPEKEKSNTPENNEAGGNDTAIETPWNILK